MEKNVHELEIKLEKEWQEALDKTFKEKNKDLKMDGFRKGAAPKELFIPFDSSAIQIKPG